ncbi:MAG: hypothetical protein LBD23_12805 [Oscillospiraceae bacterium]|jgi:hypothetical protein|nr:hypothetical protein [Oscillospiraceae bacterium]
MKKIRKLFKVLKSRSGLSLMEILVGSMMFALIAATATAVLAPMMQAYARANDFAEYNIILDSVGNKLISEIAQADDISAYGDNIINMTINGVPVVYSVNGNGILNVQREGDDREVFPEGFYKGKQVGFEVTGVVPELIVEVTVGRPPGSGPAASAAVISRNYAVMPLRLMLDQYH